jgi:hypothetical protein
VCYNEGNALGTRFAERSHAESVRQIDVTSCRRRFAWLAKTCVRLPYHW